MIFENSPSQEDSYDDFPRVLYKYRYFDTDGYHLKMLTENEIFFASPKLFNDPFDCRIRVLYEIGNRNQKINYLAEKVKSRIPSLSDKDARRKAKEQYRQNPLRNINDIQNDVNYSAENFIGVFSLSKNYKSILSWAHYADAHKGFCIGFESKYLFDLREKYTIGDRGKITFMKVNYSSEYPIINPYNNSESDYGIGQKILLTKSVDWKYEQEYRMIFLDGKNTKLHLPPDAICRVILGYQMGKARKDEIIEVLKNRPNRVNVYNAFPSTNEFKLNFKMMKI